MKVLWLSSFALENYRDAAECKFCKGEGGAVGILQEALGVGKVFPSLQKIPGSSTEQPHNPNPRVQGCNAAASVPRMTLFFS